MAVLGRTRQVVGAVRWFVHEFFGDSAYQSYLHRHALVNPEHPPMSEREFWRCRARDAEAQVESGCC